MLMLLLAADPVAFDMASVAPMLSTLGSLGFAVWFGWYVTTRMIPDMQREHRQAMLDLANEFREDVKSLGAQYERWFRLSANKHDGDGEGR